ncbi:MAG: hypothetical protein JG775_2552 [Defluviitaleaceae bacterium]|jgi:hypothetical protein|nr:hypothetical protein [Defluviitaleaceae bacterium]
MSELQEFYLLKQGKNGKWLQVTKSYESQSLIQTGKSLTEKYPGINFGVADNEGTFLWQGKGAPREAPVVDE